MNKKATNLIHRLKLILLILFFSACAYNGPGKSDIEFTELTEAEYNNLNSSVAHAGFNITRRGKTHYTWEKVFKEIVSSDFYKRSLYAGLSNPYTLGDILYKNAGNLDLYTQWKNNYFTAAEIDTITEPGNIVKNATYSKSDSLSENILLGELSELKILEQFGADFSSKIKNQCTINVTLGEYQTDEIVMGDFKKILTKDRKKHDYRSYLLEPNRYLITKLVLVKGYTITAEFNTAVGSELKVKFIKLATRDSSNSNEIKFSYDGNKTIKLVDNSEFVPFVKLTKMKKI
jgi:hypothetical protein